MKLFELAQFIIKVGLGSCLLILAYKLNQNKQKLGTGELGNKLNAGKDVIPNLLKDNIRGSLIVYDPSLEIYKITSKYQKSIGRKVILYNPLEGNFEYNPLQQCYSDREVIELGVSVVTEQ